MYVHYVIFIPNKSFVRWRLPYPTNIYCCTANKIVFVHGPNSYPALDITTVLTQAAAACKPVDMSPSKTGYLSFTGWVPSRKVSIAS